MPLPMPPAPLYGYPAPSDPGARPLLPLTGLTILAVEDSRFACDALRLLSQRSGARLRRAETLHAARAHLSVYRPDVVIVDLGLPDGRGDGLIRDIARSGVARPRLLGCSGDAGGRCAALAAGAESFLEKPLHSLAAFQQAILGIPPMPPGYAPGTGGDALPAPDLLALRDDLAQARALTAQLIAGAPGLRHGRDYLAGFVAGLARLCQDDALARAARAVRDDPEGLHRLDALLARRVGQAAPPFAPMPGEPPHRPAG